MISIIGAGPAGLYSSYLLSKHGYNVQVFDQKREIGLPVQCTGIVTSKIDDILSIREDVIKNRIRKIEVNSERTSSIITLKQPDIILDRERFDNYLAEKAQHAGAEIFLNKKLIGIANRNIIIKDIRKNKIEKKRYDYIVGADGPLSTVYNILNPAIKRSYYKGIQVRVKGNFEDDTFRVFFGKHCPDFFTWIVPEDKFTARIGLASMKNHTKLFQEFLKKMNIQRKNVIETQAGLIPVYNPRIKTEKDNIFLIGDAASQLKATTGGGIVQGLTAANSLSNAILHKISYEKSWRNVMGRELFIHLLIRKYLNRFNDDDYSRLIELLNNKSLKEILETESRDYPYRFIIKSLAAEPRLALFASKLIGY